MDFSTDAKYLPYGSWKNFLYFLSFLIILNLTACGGKKVNQIFLMPAPDIYDTGAIDPFTDTHPMEEIPYGGILYATDRKPAAEDDKEDYYLNERGFLLRLGVGKIQLGKTNMTWEEAREISLLKNRSSNYPLKITEVEETGILAESYSHFISPKVSEHSCWSLPARGRSSSMASALAHSDSLESRLCSDSS